MSKTKSIWMNPPLEQLADELGRGNKGRAGGFSRRLGDIVERYNVLLACAPKIEIDDESLMIVSAAVTGSVVSPQMIKNLPDWIRDTGLRDAGTVADAIEDMDYLSRMVLIEAAMPQ